MNYFVDGVHGDDAYTGDSGTPWRTLGKAQRAVKTGDVVRIRSAVYPEQLVITTPNTVWAADEGHTPIIDGGYNPNDAPHRATAWTRPGVFPRKGAMPPPVPDKTLNMGQWAALVQVNADGVIIDGLTVRHSAGRGITVTRADCAVMDCVVDFTVGESICVTDLSRTQPTADRVLIEGNTLTRSGVRYLVPTMTNHPAAVSVVSSRDVTVEGNTVAYHWGEGIDIHRGAVRGRASGNVVWSCRSVGIYIQCAADSVIEGNLVFDTTELEPGFFGADGNPMIMYCITDEKGSTGQFPRSTNTRVVNNIGIGGEAPFGAWQDETEWDGVYVAYNLFIAAPGSKSAMRILGPKPGRVWRNSLIENNVIIAPDGVPISNGGGWGSGVMFRNNLWSARPLAQFRGAGDVYGDPRLADVWAVIPNVAPVPVNPVDVGNYRPREDSPAIGMASDGSAANGVKPSTVMWDYAGSVRVHGTVGPFEFDGVPEPEPEPRPDWRDYLSSDRRRGLVENCRAYAAGNPSGLPGHELMLLVDELALLLDDMA